MLSLGSAHDDIVTDMNVKRLRAILTVVLLLFISATAVNASPFLRVDTLSKPANVGYRKEIIPNLVTDNNEIRAGLLYDVDRNVIVWEKDMDYAYPIASLTKMMVGLLAIEDIEAGKVNLSDRITVTRTFRQRVRRRTYRTSTVEEHYSLEDLLKMAMVASHNESTVWIAKHCSGSVEEFVARMNSKAQQLGMTKTLYSNTSGLPAIIDELDNSASPGDLLLLSLELLKHKKLMEITDIPYATVSNGKGSATYRNHNGLVINYQEDVDGLKTGYTKAAKFCLCATANRSGHRLISIVLGVRSPWVRNGIVASMMNTYFQAIRLGRLGETAADADAACAFIDSVNRGLAVIAPEAEPRRQDSSDEAFAYTYKTVTQQVRKIHVVRSGDNLGRIADRFNVSVAELKRWNKLRGSTIHKGQKLAIVSTVKKRIPVKLVVDPDESYADAQPVQDPDGDVQTEVTRDDSAASTATAQKSSVKQSEGRNNVKKEVPASTVTKQAAVKPQYIIHTVQPGDTLWNIAQRYQANMDQIRKMNRLGSGRLLKSGTRIKIPVKGG